MQPAERLVLINGGALFVLGVVMALFNPEYFHETYSAEDGVMEWLTVMTLATVAVLTAGRLFRGYREFGWVQRLVLALLALLAVFGAGEELSWGQRLFGVNSSEFFLDHNIQGETNLHNLEVAGVNLNKLLFAKGFLLFFIFYLAVLTPLYHRSDRIRALADSCGVPIPKTYQIAGYVMVILSVEGLLNLVPGDVPRRGELTEFAIPVLAALNIIYPLNLAVFETGGEDGR